MLDLNFIIPAKRGKMFKHETVESKTFVLKEKTKIVIFGATGDLTKRKILPALFNLFIDGHIDNQIEIIGFAKQPLTDKSWKQILLDNCINNFSSQDEQEKFPYTKWKDFENILFYFKGNFTNKEDYHILSKQFFTQKNLNHLFYLACAPEFFSEIAANIAHAKIITCNKSVENKFWSRLVVEKPFGYNLETACQLNQRLTEAFRDNDIFRIDHYLGKEALQNLLLFRFSNSVFESLWNRRFITKMEIRLFETEGIGKRGGYYDRTGAIRDMIQNHMMQILCLIAMEPPISLSPKYLREEKLRILRAIPSHVSGEWCKQFIIGQYTSGRATNGSFVSNYQDEPKVKKYSKTETFASIWLGIENWRWAGIPFVLITGKALDENCADIIIHFRQPDKPPYSGILGNPGNNYKLIINFKPEDGITINFNNTNSPAGIRDKFKYSIRSRKDRVLKAYERLLLDIFYGDHTLFTQFEEVEESWRIVDSIQKSIKSFGIQLQEYSAGTKGPVLENFEKVSLRNHLSPAKDYGSD